MIPDEVAETLFLKMRNNEQVRIEHRYRDDGSRCSIGKDPCLTITKTPDGLKYFCHRCDEGGFYVIKTLSPDATVAAWKRLQEPPPSKDESVDDVILPSDCVPVVKDGKWNSMKVPNKAIHWMWESGFQIPTEVTWECYWSDSEKRVLFPIRSKDRLEGYVGRDVSGEMSKYRTIKRKDIDRLYYTAQGDDEHVVFTEDIMSARKVNAATGYTAVALLTTHVTLKTLVPFKKYNIFLWLDGDMLSKSTQLVSRMNQFGMRIRSIRTILDPKKYNDIEIRRILNDDA